MSIQVGSTNKTLRFEAYLSDGTLKTDLVAADVDTMLVRRSGLADVTIYNETGPVGSVGDKASPQAAHSDGDFLGMSNGRYTVDAPDTAFATAADEVQVYGTWTDGSDSGYFVGSPEQVVGYDPSATAVGAAVAGNEMGLSDDAITSSKIANGALTSAKFASGAFDAVWSVSARTLSAFGFTVTTDAESRTASQADVSGLATAANVSDAQTAIINAVNAVNTGAARYISIHTNAAYEIPDSGSVAYPIEIRTFDADGEPVAIDSAANPTVIVTRTTDSTDLSGNLAAISNPATGIYRTTLTITQGSDVVAPLRIDASGTIAATSRSTSAYPVVTDAVAVDFTQADRDKLNTITGTDGVTLATTQDNYAPAKPNEVKSQVVAALNEDIYSEPGQESPSATATLVAKIGYLFKAWRNKTEQTSTEYRLFNDTGDTVDQKSTVSDDGTTTAVGEVSTGP